MIDSVNINGVDEVLFDDTLVTEETVNQDEMISLEEIKENPKYTIVDTTTIQELSENVIAEIETVSYTIKDEENKDDEVSLRAVSNGTKFGTYSTITIRDTYFGRLMGKVGVEVQGQKISSSKAKIVFIKYENVTKFANNAKGAINKYGVGNTGNPAIGSVLVSYRTQNYDAGWVTDQRLIYVKVYPTTKINVTL